MRLERCIRTTGGDWKAATKGSAASSPGNNRWENIADPIIKVTGMRQHLKPKSIKVVLKLARICKGRGKGTGTGTEEGAANNRRGA